MKPPENCIYLRIINNDNYSIMKHLFTILLLCLFMGGAIGQNVVIDDKLQEVLNQNQGEKISVNIILKAQMNSDDLKVQTRDAADRKSQRTIAVSELKKYSEKSQHDVLTVLKSAERNNDVADIRCHWLINAINCKLTKDVIYELSVHPDVATIAYDEQHVLFTKATSVSAEPERAMTQNITHVNADDVWDLGYTGKGVLVAMLDTGANLDHVDLKDNLWDGGSEYPNHGYNTYDNNHDVHDGFEHGTHCGGIICGNGTSGTQTGIAPDATLMVVKVVDDAGSGGASTICAGMEFALEHDADVLNMSLGIPSIVASSATREMLRSACVNTMEAGVAAAIAVGNDGQLQISFPVPNSVRIPAGCPPPWIHPDQEANAGGTSCCIAVAAVDYNDERAPFSSVGPYTWQETSYADYPYDPGIGLIRPDVSAPGVGIKSCDPKSNTGHVTMDGTSQATPCVAGVIALMLEKNPNLTPADICMILETTATQLSENKDNYTGSGCINALAAIEQVQEGGDIVTPLSAPTNVKAVAESTSSISLTWDAVENALSYNVYNGNDVVANVTENSYLVENLEYNTEYCFTVSAVNDEEESEKSEEACEKTLGDGVNELSSSMQIYPNPVGDKLYIETDKLVEDVTIYNVMGNVVGKTAGVQQSIDVSDLSEGVYFVKFRLNNGEVMKKFVKQ